MNKFFEVIYSNDLIHKGKINKTKIAGLSNKVIGDISESLSDLASIKTTPLKADLFTHAASISLGGADYPCSSLECRKERLKQLAQFSTLYSDRVYIPNYFRYYTPHEHDGKLNIQDIQAKFADDLQLVEYLKPLILDGKIVPVTPPNYCTRCLTKLIYGTEDKRFEKISIKLINLYRKEITVIFNFFIDNKALFLIQGPDYLIEHGGAGFLADKDRIGINKYPRLLKDHIENVTLLKREIKGLGIDVHLVSAVLRSIYFDLVSAQQLKTNFLTDRQIEIDVLNKLSNTRINKHNDIIEKYLSCMVPFINDADPIDILKLRKREEDAFKIFRSAINRAVVEYCKNKSSFTEKDAKQIYHDIIEPKLIQIDRKINSSYKDLFKGVGRKMLGWTASISLGFYTGILPKDLAGIAAAVGAIKTLAEFSEYLMTQSDKESEVKENDMYFLWKVKQNIK